ncbi:MAG: hypothetical protein KGO02_02915 [Alphaproteobacteria bacterium]|nr:hypothetical protein [Alphaproteobacteria bacterium]
MDQYVGALIGLGFGYGWIVAGCLALERRYRYAALMLSGVVAAGTALLLLRAHGYAAPTPLVHARWIIYDVTVIFEVLAIAGSIGWLVRRRRTELIMPVVGIIAGLHFVGLWAATAYAQPGLLFAAIGMIGACVLAIRSVGPSRVVLAGLGCGGVLWLAAVSVLV